MTEEELQAIEVRANAATPGPWVATGGGEVGAVVDGENKPWALVEAFGELQTADAEFIANAITDVPALLAEVRRLQEAGADCFRRLERAHDEADKYQSRALDAEAALKSPRYSTEAVDALLEALDGQVDGPDDVGHAVAAVRASREPKQ